MQQSRQYLRACSVIVQNASGTGVDLAKLRVVFSVKKTASETPNAATIRVLNLSDATAKQIQEEFKTIILQAGYESNFGLIFSGNIKQVSFGKESSVDKYIDIAAGDGDQSNNFSYVSRTLAAGSTQIDEIKEAATSMQSEGGVSLGFVDDLKTTSLPRGKVMFGMSKDYLHSAAKTTDAMYTIQNGKIEIVKRTSTLPGAAIVLNSSTGLIGIPQQTNDGIAASCLLNPLLKVNGKVKINEKDVAKIAGDEEYPEIQSDGIYRILSLEHIGDTYGNDWITNFICVGVDESAPAGSQVINA